MQLGLSESARVTTAQEARFRIDYPNSRPRAARIIALDEAAEAALHELEGQEWNDAHFLRYIEAVPAADTLQMLSIDAVVRDQAGKKRSLVEEIENAQVIVMVTSAGTDARAAEVIATACFVRNKLTTGLVLADHRVETGDLARTLTALRPYAAMLVVSSGAEYIGAMLTALRA